MSPAVPTKQSNLCRKRVYTTAHIEQMSGASARYVLPYVAFIHYQTQAPTIVATVCLSPPPARLVLLRIPPPLFVSKQQNNQKATRLTACSGPSPG